MWGAYVHKRPCFSQSIYNLFNHFRGFLISANREEATEGQVNSLSDSNEFALFVRNCQPSERGL